MLIFDIGANVGLFTDKCLNIFGDDLNVIMVEANPNLVKLLNNKYKNHTNIKVLNNLVSEKNDLEIDFYISETHVISTASIDWIKKSRFTDNYRWDKPIKVNSITLDKLIELFGNPNLIKIDVEGYELEVIRGLSKKTNEICFEWAEEEYDKINIIAENLVNLGFQNFGYILGDDYLRKPNKFSSWDALDIHALINPKRKEMWGMIWVN